MRVTLINTDREKEIELGVNYPYGPLKQGECLLASAQQANLKVQVGHQIQLNVSVPYTIDAVIE